MNNKNFSLIFAALMLIGGILLLSGATLGQGVTLIGITSGNSKSPVFPVYPPEALAQKVQDLVQVSVSVDEKGNVISAKATSGNPLLQPAAVAAAAQTKFDPQINKGTAVKFSSIIIYSFNLTTAAQTPNYFEPTFDDFSEKNEDIYNRAKKYFARSDYKSTISELDRIILGQRTEYLLLRARADYALKDYAKALAAGNEAVQMGEREQESGSFLKGWISPNLPSAYYRRGEIYEALGDNDKAAADYRRAHELAPDDPLPGEKLANLMARQKGTNETKVTINSAPKFKTDFDEFKFYFDEYSRLSTIYDTQYRKYTEAQNAMIGRPSNQVDSTQICRDTSEINETYKLMRVQYAKMKSMIERGKMNQYPNIKKDLMTEEDELDDRGAKILSANYLWGCKVFVD